MSYYLINPPKTEEEKYAYDIIQKAYWINEKNIEMLDYKKRNKLIEDYFWRFNYTKKQADAQYLSVKNIRFFRLS